MSSDCFLPHVQKINNLQKKFTDKKTFINKKNKVSYKLWRYTISDYFTFQNQCHLHRQNFSKFLSFLFTIRFFAF